MAKTLKNSYDGEPGTELDPGMLAAIEACHSYARVAQGHHKVDDGQDDLKTEGVAHWTSNESHKAKE